MADVFDALASPMRREILTLLANGPTTIDVIIKTTRMSYTNAYSHTQLLVQAGLITGKRVGSRPIVYSVNKTAFSVIEDYVASVKRDHPEYHI